MIATISTLSEWHGYTHACVRVGAGVPLYYTAPGLFYPSQGSPALFGPRQPRSPGHPRWGTGLSDPKGPRRV